MKISSIEKQKHHKNRFSIFVDKKFSFGISDNVLTQLNLQIGQDVEPEDVVKISELDDIDKATKLAIRYKSFRPRTELEFKNFLIKKNYSTNVVGEVLKNLHSISFINDAEFARMFVSDRIKLRPASRLLLEKQLQQKGVSKSIASETLNKFYPAASELEIATKLAAKKISHKPKNKLSVAEVNKVVAYLLRRGFSYSIAHEVLKNTSTIHTT